MSQLNTIFYILVLIMSVVIHEVSHGYAALAYGDETAKYAGRLTLNPIKHLDPFGSVILPLLLILTHAGFVVGWARPVPYNERNLRDPKWGTVAVAISGILANLSLAIIFSIVIRIVIYAGMITNPLTTIFSIIVLVNLLLALFNLIPIPPLDGSKILMAFLPASYLRFVRKYEQFGVFFLLLFIMLGWQYVSHLIFSAYTFLTGISPLI